MENKNEFPIERTEISEAEAVKLFVDDMLGTDDLPDIYKERQTAIWQSATEILKSYGENEEQIGSTGALIGKVRKTKEIEIEGEIPLKVSLMQHDGSKDKISLNFKANQGHNPVLRHFFIENPIAEHPHNRESFWLKSKPDKVHQEAALRLLDSLKTRLEKQIPDQ